MLDSVTHYLLNMSAKQQLYIGLAVGVVILLNIWYDIEAGSLLDKDAQPNKGVILNDHTGLIWQYRLASLALALGVAAILYTLIMKFDDLDIKMCLFYGMLIGCGGKYAADGLFESFVTIPTARAVQNNPDPEPEDQEAK